MPCLFVEQLTVIDCAWLDAARGLVGDSWIVDLELEGDLDDQGMVVDFGEVKRRLRKAAEDVADHRLVVPRASERLEFVRSGERTGLAFKADTGAIEHQAPAGAVCLLEAAAVTGEVLADAVQHAVARVAPANVRNVRVGLRREEIDGAHYHYAHGLAKHAGQCQRIAHGHRSRLEILVDGRRDLRLARSWADRWRDIYLGTSGHVVSHLHGRLRFQYRSGEGEFELELPAERCDLLQTESTVECIAEHIAAQLSQQRPGERLEVRAYEGVMKGARAVRG